MQSIYVVSKNANSLHQFIGRSIPVIAGRSNVSRRRVEFWPWAQRVEKKRRGYLRVMAVLFRPGPMAMSRSWLPGFLLVIEY